MPCVDYWEFNWGCLVEEYYVLFIWNNLKWFSRPAVRADIIVSCNWTKGNRALGRKVMNFFQQYRLFPTFGILASPTFFMLTFWCTIISTPPSIASPEKSGALQMVDRCWNVWLDCLETSCSPTSILFVGYLWRKGNGMRLTGPGYKGRRPRVDFCYLTLGSHGRCGTNTEFQSVTCVLLAVTHIQRFYLTC